MSPLEASDALRAWRSTQPGLRSTSFPVLDTVSDGLVPGRVWLITSTPGQGRSTLAIQWALLLATSHGVRTDLVSVREPVHLVAARLLSAAGKIPVSHLWADETTPGEEPKVRATRDLLADTPLQIAGPRHLRAELRRARYRDARGAGSR